MKPRPIKIRLLTVVDGEDSLSLLCDGLLRVEGERQIITYAEKEEGGTTATRLTIEEGRVSLLRHGGVNYSTVYEEGRTHTSLYSLGGLTLDAAVSTERLSVTRGDYPSFLCDYTLSLGEEHRRFHLSLQTEGRVGE